MEELIIATKKLGRGKLVSLMKERDSIIKGITDEKRIRKIEESLLIKYAKRLR